MPWIFLRSQWQILRDFKNDDISKIFEFLRSPRAFSLSCNRAPELVNRQLYKTNGNIVNLTTEVILGSGFVFFLYGTVMAEVLS